MSSLRIGIVESGQFQRIEPRPPKLPAVVFDRIERALLRQAREQASAERIDTLVKGYRIRGVTGTTAQ